MKKHLAIILSILLLVSSVAYAVEYFARYSDTLTVSANVTSAGGYLSDVYISTDAATTCTWNLYDSAGTGATTEVIPTIVATTTEYLGGGRYRHLTFDPPIKFYRGLYASISSTGEMKVYYIND